MPPRLELFQGQVIAFARVVSGQDAPIHRGHDFGLAAGHPAPRVGWRQIGERGLPRFHLHDCRAFLFPVNVDALDDIEGAQCAVKKYRSLFDVSDPDVQLSRAAIVGDVDVLRHAIEIGADVNVVFPDP